MDKPGKPLEALAEAMLNLSEARRGEVANAFRVAETLGATWRSRYESTAWALSQLGARRSGRRSDSLWNMPCGCIYSLHYARPVIFHRCNRHPGEPFEWRDLIRISITLLLYAIYASLSTYGFVSVIVVAEHLLNLLGGKRSSVGVVGVPIWIFYVGAAASVILLAYVLKRRKSP